jgi:hypothetical protein
VREVDRLHHADDQHEAERDEREQQPQRDAVQEVRQEVDQEVHGKPGAVSPLLA